MPSPRLVLSNASNSPRSWISTRPPFDFGSKKASPTLTLSITNVSNNGRCEITNLIDFPSMSQPDDTEKDENDPMDPTERPLATPSTSVQNCPPLTKRKRSNARLAHPISLSNTDSNCDAEYLRKRQRLLIKGMKQGAPRRMMFLSASDLRFVASVQRCIALGVMERWKKDPQLKRYQRAFGLTSNGMAGVPNDKKSVLGAQDVLLARRLRTLLLNRGVQASEVIDLNQEESSMDLDPADVGRKSPPSCELETGLCLQDMDLDDSPFPRSSPPPPPSTTSLISHSTLVATLIMRHYCNRKPTRSSFSAGRERRGKSHNPRQPSPLSCTSTCPPAT